MHAVEGFDFSHGGVEASGDQPERVALFDFILFRELSLKIIDYLDRPRDPLRGEDDSHEREGHQ